MFILLLTSMLTFAFNIQPVRAEGTIYIWADGGIDPQDAPISTLDNVTYTVIGNITSDAGGVVVERDNIVVNGAGYTIQGTEISDAGIFLSGRSNVTITNIEIREFFRGICLTRSLNNTLAGNDITNTHYVCIQLESSNCSSIYGNSMTNYPHGILLSSFSNCNSIYGTVLVVR